MYANRRGKFEARTFDLPLDHRRDLTVGEIWKEKKNIVIVGDAEASFVLYCARIPGTCNIFNTRTMSLVLLEPGKRKVSSNPIQVFYHLQHILQVVQSTFRQLLVMQVAFYM